jgi:small conductance mechanosensitive channel
MVLHDEGVTIDITELGDNAVIFTFRTWVKTANYWPAFFALNEEVKKSI